MVQSLRARNGLDSGAGVGIPGSSRHRSIVSISMVAGRGGDAGSSADESRHHSIVSISVVTGRGGGADAGTFGSHGFNNVWRSANPTKGVATAVTTRSAGITASSLTIFTGQILAGAGFTKLRSSTSAWLSHTLHLSTMSRIGVPSGTLSRCCRRSVLVTGNEPVTNHPDSHAWAYIPENFNRQCLQFYCEYGRVLDVPADSLFEFASVFRQSFRRSVILVIPAISALTNPIRVALCGSGTKRATFSASPSRWDRSCRATVLSSQPFDLTLASNTCLYWSD